MEERGVFLVVEDDKKRADLSAILSKLGIRVKAPRCADSSKEEVRRLKKEFSLHLRKSRELEEAYDTTLENFMAALDLRDVETYGHSKTVARYSHVLAGACGIRDAARLDRIGKGARPPRAARSCAVADPLDAGPSPRPYRAPRDFKAARRELKDNAGGQFDPKVVDGFCGTDLAVWEKIRFETARLMPPIEDY